MPCDTNKWKPYNPRTVEYTGAFMISDSGQSRPLPSPLGLPTLVLGIPGLPHLSFPLPLPFLPSPPSFYSPLPPSLTPWIPPLKKLGGVGERCKLPEWGLGQSPSQQTIWCISEPNGVALVATVFVHFHRNTFNFCTNTRLCSSLLWFVHMIFLKQSMSRDTVLVIICWRNPHWHSCDDALLRDTLQQVPIKQPSSPMPFYSSQIFFWK